MGAQKSSPSWLSTQWKSLSIATLVGIFVTLSGNFTCNTYARASEVYDLKVNLNKDHEEMASVKQNVSVIKNELENINKKLDKLDRKLDEFKSVK